MPLNRPALSLGAGPRGVRDARQWVAMTFGDIDRSDLTECAELGVSELVTNALLHATPPIHVAVRGTREHPRVEVRDTSLDKLVLPAATEHDADAVLLTFGRGLNIVARASDAWGAEIEDDGKIVWFTPAKEFATTGTEGVITGVTTEEPRAAASDDGIVLDIRNVPVGLYTAFQRHYRELRREVRLLALAHEHEYPLAKALSDLFGSLERPLRYDLGAEQVEAARQAGETHLDLDVVMRRPDTIQVEHLSELLALADEFCREERLLSLARSPEQVHLPAVVPGRGRTPERRRSTRRLGRRGPRTPPHQRLVKTNPRVLIAVAVGGALGAVLRFALVSWIPDGGGIPWTTFGINLSGSAALAGLGGLHLVRTSTVLAAGLGPGLLGGFTTMSAASEQTRSLFEGGYPVLAVSYLLGSVLCCVVGVLLVRGAVPRIVPLVET